MPYNLEFSSAPWQVKKSSSGLPDEAHYDFPAFVEIQRFRQIAIHSCGNASFFIAEVGAVVLATIWAFVFTYAMLFIIDRVVTVRVSEATEDVGLDAGLHGEEAYAGI